MVDRRLSRILAFLRSRLLAAVLAPALIGAAYSGGRGVFSGIRLALVCLGLAAAELIALLAVDFRTHWERSRPVPRSFPSLPGNPVFDSLPPARLPLLMTALGIIGAAVLAYFYYLRGPVILYFLAGASMAASLYIFNPFPFAFLAVLTLPPLLTGGVHTSLSGGLDAGAFLVGLPSAFILAGTNWAFRRLYSRGEDFFPGRALVVLLFFSLSLCAVVALIVLKVLPSSANAASVILLAGLYLSFQVFKHEQKSPVPAVTVGVALYVAVALSLALSMIF